MAKSQKRIDVVGAQAIDRLKKAQGLAEDLSSQRAAINLLEGRYDGAARSAVPIGIGIAAGAVGLVLSISSVLSSGSVAGALAGLSVGGLSGAAAYLAGAEFRDRRGIMQATGALIGLAVTSGLSALLLISTGVAALWVVATMLAVVGAGITGWRSGQKGLRQGLMARELDATRSDLLTAESRLRLELDDLRTGVEDAIAGLETDAGLEPLHCAIDEETMAQHTNR